MRFCGRCGTALAARCPHCGAEAPPDFRFCGHCGKSLQEPAPAPAPDSALILELDARGFGMGTRGQRFAIIVDDGRFFGLITRYDLLTYLRRTLP